MHSPNDEEKYDSNKGAGAKQTEVRPILESTIDARHSDTDTTMRKQYLAAILASLISLSTGCVGGWSSPATPQLLNGTFSDLGIGALSMEEASWVGSLINLGAFFGSMPAGYMSFRFGRKVCLLILAWPIIIGWLLIIFNQNNVWFLYMGRLISGLSYGSMNVALPIYNNEICCDKIRGRVGTVYDLLQCMGLLYVYWLATTFSLLWTTVYCMLVPIFFFFTFIWMPESPLYLVRTGRKHEAIRSIRWLYGENCDVNWQLERIHRALLEGRESGIGDSSQNKRCGFFSPVTCVKVFTRSLCKVTVKATLIAFFMFVVQRSCGATMIQYYGDSIFQLANSSIEPGYATVLIGITSVAGSLVSVVAVDTIGRRFLLTFSFFIMTLSMAIFTAYVAFIVVNGDDTFLTSLSVDQYYGLIPAITLCIFVAMFRLGVSPVPWFMAPEIIPTEAQKWAPSVIVCITWGMSFGWSKCFLPAIEAFGQVPVYTFFVVVCGIGFLYTLLVIPETKNKSREQIQRELGASVSYDEL